VRFGQSVRIEEFQSASIGSGFVAAGSQQAFQGTANGIVIIDNGNRGCSVHRGVLRHVIGS
jgi:hypothetical protein